MGASALLLAGCVGGPPGSPDPALPAALAPEVAFDRAAPTVATVRWSAGPGAHRVRYGPGLARQTPEVSGRDPAVAVLGLPPGARWPFVAESTLASGQVVRSAVGELEVPDDQLGAPSFTVTVSDPSRSTQAEAWLLLSLITSSGSWVVILDGDGAPVWTVRQPDDRTSAWPRPGRDGATLLFESLPRARDVDVGTIERVGLDGSPVQSTFATLAHHGFVELPDGDFAWMGLAFGVWDTPDPPLVGPIDVMSDTVLEGPPGATDAADTRVLFGFLDAEQPLFVPCSHFDDLESHFGVDDVHEWTHANSLVWDEASDVYYVGARLHDAIFAIDGATGAPLWQMGGVRSDFAFAAPGDAWSHGHFSQMWDDGLVMFDNALHDTQPASRIVEYAYDADARTVEAVWSYAEPSGATVGYLGDARKLSNGDYLAVWNTLGRVDEIAPDGEIVWSVSVDAGGEELALGRAWPIADLYAPARP